MSQYIAFIDYIHLEDPFFLKSFAQSLSAHKTRKGIIIHGDSAYTDRLIQTGMMREDARKRAIMDLNHRLVALFADYGVSTIGVHGFQKELISISNDEIQLNRKALNDLPDSPMLLLSSLVNKDGEKHYIPPVQLAEFLSEHLESHEVVIFSHDQKSELLTTSDEETDLNWQNLDENFVQKHLSEEQTELKKSVTLTTSSAFSEWPNPKKAFFIR